MSEQEFFDKMIQVWVILQRLKDDVEKITKQMQDLEKQGMTNATIHTRSDNGGMELIHPSNSDYHLQKGRRREYIGTKAEAQEEAQARIKRFNAYTALSQERYQKEEKIRAIERRIHYLLIETHGTQAKLFSEVGTEPSSGPEKPVPTDYSQITPQMVIDYFKASSVLVEMSEDVQAVLGKMVRADKQIAA